MLFSYIVWAFVPFLLSLLDILCQITCKYKVAKWRNRWHDWLCDFCRWHYNTNISISCEFKAQYRNQCFPVARCKHSILIKVLPYFTTICVRLASFVSSITSSFTQPIYIFRGIFVIFVENLLIIPTAVKKVESSDKRKCFVCLYTFKISFTLAGFSTITNSNLKFRCGFNTTFALNPQCGNFVSTSWQLAGL